MQYDHDAPPWRSTLDRVLVWVPAPLMVLQGLPMAFVDICTRSRLASVISCGWLPYAYWPSMANAAPDTSFGSLTCCACEHADAN